MLRATTNRRKEKNKKLKRRVMFPGIASHAEKLGVSRVHLWRVLSGQRQSGVLMAQYQQLIRKEAA